MTLTRQQKNKINNALISLESLEQVFDNEQELKQARQKGVRLLHKIITDANISKPHPYWTRLQEIEVKYLLPPKKLQKSDAQEDSQNNVLIEEDPKFNRGKRDYLGNSGLSEIRVTPVYDHIFLSKRYHGKFKLSWRFNRKGRLELIDAMKFITNEGVKINEINHILLTYAFKKKLEPGWNESKAKINYAPYLKTINEFFEEFSREEKFQHLTYYGHLMAKKLYENIVNRNLKKGKHILNPNQRHLTEIINDPEAIYLINQVGKLINCLKVELLGNRRVRITYN